MRIILCFLISLLLCNTAYSQTLQQRLADAAADAETVSNQLLAVAADSLTSEDWLVLSEAQLRLRNKQGALDAVDNALAKASTPYLQAHANLLKAQIYGILYRDTVFAVTMLERAENLLIKAEDAPSMQLYSEVLQNFAQAYNQLGNIPKAIPYAEHALALAITLQQPEAELSAHIMIGRLTLQNNAYSLAYRHLEQALQLATQLNDKDALASIHLRLGMAYRKIDYHQQALKHLLQAQALYKTLKRPSSYTYTLLYIAETYLESVDTAAEAQRYLTEALELARQQDDLLRVAIATSGLGRLAALQQQDELAVSHFNDALQLFRQQQVGTYLQETNLELGDLLLRRQQADAAQQLLQELSTDIDQAATYLRYRYFDFAARVAAAQSRWAEAYNYMLQANSLRFEQQAEKTKLQFDIVNQGLQQAVANSSVQTELAQAQRQMAQQQTYVIWLCAISAALALLLLIGFWYNKKRSAGNITVLESSWANFCQRTQLLCARTDINLVCYAFSASQQYKIRHGEQALQQLLQHYLPQAPAQLLNSGVFDDVIWFALDADASAKTTEPVLAAFEAMLPAQLTQGCVYQLQLPLANLQSQWHSKALYALPQALWLTAALCQHAQPKARRYNMALRATLQGSCEWRSSMVRQDLLNAIRLENIVLYCNGNALAATLGDSLS